MHPTRANTNREQRTTATEPPSAKVMREGNGRMTAKQLAHLLGPEMMLKRDHLKITLKRDKSCCYFLTATTQTLWRPGHTRDSYTSTVMLLGAITVNSASYVSRSQKVAGFLSLKKYRNFMLRCIVRRWSEVIQAQMNPTTIETKAKKKTRTATKGYKFDKEDTNTPRIHEVHL
jgi:hypothetical protein